MARMRAFLDEPPQRSESEHVTVLDYLGIRNLRLDRYRESAAAFREASELVPNPRFMVQWGIAATEAGDYRDALECYKRLIARTPDDPLAWRGYTAMTSRLGDLVEARHGANELLKRAPGDPDALRLLAEIDREEARRAAAAGSPAAR
jgi:tetratricopeptide (TPR) repeat protein